MSYLITATERREYRERAKSNRRKCGPVFDPRTITEPVSTVAQRTEIERLRKALAAIPSSHKTSQWLRTDGRMPNTSREADRLIGLLWDKIEKRLGELPEGDNPERFRIYQQVKKRREQSARNASTV